MTSAGAADSMAPYDRFDAIVVGSGPNGLAAAVELARAGKSVRVYEAKPTIGGGTRTLELTQPGYWSDVCSAIHPLGAGSPFFRTLPLADYGLEWIHPPLALAHPFDDGTAAVLERSVEATADSLGGDAGAYRQLMAPLVADWEPLSRYILGPFRPPAHPVAMARFGLSAIQSAKGLADRHFKGERARALFAGLAAHSMLPLEQPPSAAFGLVLGVAGHAVGWPFPRGGSRRIAEALAGYLRTLYGQVVTGTPVESLDGLPPSRAILCDVGPRQLVALAGQRLPEGYTRHLRAFRYGPGAFKIDYALDGPIPWRAAACGRAGTVHVGGTLDEIAAAERSVWRGVPPERPFVLVAQQSLFDPTRAPDGKQVAWVYCHVPNGSAFDMTERIEAQIERFAPGFRERVLARHVMTPRDLHAYNPNYVGGDINGGTQDLRQLFTRPVARVVPYTTPTHGIYVCSSSTPPGGGVHGMCGYYAARAALWGMHD